MAGPPKRRGARKTLPSRRACCPNCRRRRCSLHGESTRLFHGTDQLLDEFVVRLVRREHDTIEANTQSQAAEPRYSSVITIVW